MVRPFHRVLALDGRRGIASTARAVVGAGRKRDPARQNVSVK